MPETPPAQQLKLSIRDQQAFLGLFTAGDRMFARPLIQRISERRAATLERALEMYVRQFGEQRSLTDGEFLALFGDAVNAVEAAGKEAEPSSFFENCRQIGVRLASRGIPFSEFIVGLYFFEDACLAGDQVLPNADRMHRAFDRLSHQLVASVSTSYVTLRGGEAAAQRAFLEREVQKLPPKERSVFHGLIGQSAVMRRLFARLSAAAPRPATVLIVGETGTGKELCAKAIHELSRRRSGPFVPVNCAAIPRELLPSELFGHRRGAFTGAFNDSRGLIAAAEGGTLFLDEVTEMDEPAQVALLRVLEQHTIRPIGAITERAIDVRFVAATNLDPEEAVKSKKLREDLFHRIAATTIEVPPLRERIDDLPLLVDYFLVRIAGSEMSNVPILTPDAQEVLRQYLWPGNVRELANCLESAVTFSQSAQIEVADLPERVLRGRKGETSATVANPPVAFTTVHDSELDLIRRTIEQHKGNKASAARALGISRKKLYAKLDELTDQPPAR
ncbi:MAG: sigma-54 interaction domain-containing protein [Planctomycetota bacterium]